MAAGLTRRVAPDALGGGKTSRVFRVERARLGNADPHMAVEAKALLAVATLALLRLHAGFDGVHVQVVVGVNSPRTHAPIVAIGAEVFFVAIRAELRVVGGYRFVAFDEIRRVLGVVQPPRRLEGA